MYYKGKAEFIEGTPVKGSDLNRVSADVASAFYLLANQQAKVNHNLSSFLSMNTIERCHDGRITTSLIGMLCLFGSQRERLQFLNDHTFIVLTLKSPRGPFWVSRCHKEGFKITY